MVATGYSPLFCAFAHLLVSFLLLEPNMQPLQYTKEMYISAPFPRGLSLIGQLQGKSSIVEKPGEGELLTWCYQKGKREERNEGGDQLSKVMVPVTHFLLQGSTS